MKLSVNKCFGMAFVILSLNTTLSPSAHALEPQTLFNFQITPSPVTGALVEGSDGNFYFTTPQAGATGIATFDFIHRNGAIFRVTPTGELTAVVSELTNVCSALIVGNDGQLYGTTGAGGGTGFGTVFRLNTNGTLTHFAVFDGVNGNSPASVWCSPALEISTASR